MNRIVNYGTGQVGIVLIEPSTTPSISEAFYMNPASSMSIGADELIPGEEVTIQYQSPANDQWYDLVDSSGSPIQITSAVPVFDVYNTALNYRAIKPLTTNPVGVWVMRSNGRGV